MNLLSVVSITKCVTVTKATVRYTMYKDTKNIHETPSDIYEASFHFQWRPTYNEWVITHGATGVTLIMKFTDIPDKLSIKEKKDIDTLLSNIDTRPVKRQKQDIKPNIEEINQIIKKEMDKKFTNIFNKLEEEIDIKIRDILLKTENSELGRIINLKKILVEQIHSERETFNKLKNDADDVAKLRKSIRANIHKGATAFTTYINTYTTKVTHDYNKWTVVVDSTTTNIYNIEKEFKESIKNLSASISISISTRVTSINSDITKIFDEFKTLIHNKIFNIEAQSNTFLDCMKNIVTKINDQITNMHKFMRIELQHIKI